MSNGDSPELDTNRGDARRPVLALIAGPTASGKTDLAVQLALALAARGQRAVVLNADSAQVYADLEILSARPTQGEMQNIEHRLFGIWDGAQPCSAAEWAAAARSEIAALHTEGAVPILVGGTGLYIRTLLDGIAPIPEISPTIRAEVRALPTPDAYAALQMEDPQRAARLNANDTTRISRALEVVRSTGIPLGQWQERLEGGIGAAVDLHPAILTPPRDWLYERCDRRFELMLDRGGVGEVETLLARDLPAQLPVMRAIGVPEISGWISGAFDRNEAIRRAAQATRNYAKRQYTWFRGQASSNWPRIENINCDIEIIFETLLHK